MARVSSYTIIVDLPNGSYALAHGYTGALDIVSGEVGSKLLTGGEAVTEIEENDYLLLKSRGYITDLSVEDEQRYLLRLALAELKKNDALSRVHFTFVITYDCNFCCPYCYERDLFNHDIKSRQKIITKELVDDAFEAIGEIRINARQTMNQIMLFGGEPLLKQNRDIVAYIIEKGKKLGYGFTATSNGYDIDSYADLLGDYGIRSIQITLDGSRDDSNARRKHVSGYDTFDKIISNIKLALSKNVLIRLRINVDYYNKDSIATLYEMLVSEGISGNKYFSAYVEFISGEVNFNPSGYDKPLNKYSRKDFINQFNSLPSVVIDNRIAANIENAINNRRKLYLNPKHCSAQAGSYIFDPFGNIYSCYDEIGKTDSRIGTYNKGLKWYNPAKETWFSRNITGSQACSKCKYALLCGGGCYSKQLISKRKTGFCDDFSLRFKSSLRTIINNFITYKKQGQQ